MLRRPGTGAGAHTPGLPRSPRPGLHLHGMAAPLLDVLSTSTMTARSKAGTPFVPVGDPVYVDEVRNLGCFDRFLLELRGESLSWSGYYPKYGRRLNWVVAFGKGGEMFGMNNRPNVWLLWKIVFLVVQLSTFVWIALIQWDDGRYCYYLTTWTHAAFVIYAFAALFTTIRIRLTRSEVLGMPLKSARFDKGGAERIVERYSLGDGGPVTLETLAKNMRNPRERDASIDVRVATSTLDRGSKASASSAQARPQYALSEDIPTHYEREQNAAMTVDDYLPMYCRFTWFMHSFSLLAGISVFVMFWGFAVPTLGPDVTGVTSGLGFVQHLLVIALVLFDWYLSNVPFLLGQCVWVSLYGLVYILWTVVHHQLELTSAFCLDPAVHCIYPPFNWNQDALVSTLLLTTPLLLGLGPFIALMLWIVHTEIMRKIYKDGGSPWVDLLGYGRATPAPRPWWGVCC